MSVARWWRVFWLVSRRLARRQLGLLVALIVVIAIPMLAVTVSSIAGYSARAQNGELAARTLGPYQLRSGATSATEAAALTDDQPGVEAVTVGSAGGVIRTGTSAASGRVVIGEPDPRLWASQYSVLAGALPLRPGEGCLTDPLDSALGAQLGQRLSVWGRNITVVCRLRSRSEYFARQLVVWGDPRAVEQSAAADPSIQFDRYVSGPTANIDQLREKWLRQGLGVVGVGASTEDNNVQTSDGEFVMSLSRASILMLLVACAVSVGLMASLSRAYGVQVTTLVYLGVTPGLRAGMTSAFATLVTLPAALIGWAVAFPLARSWRSGFERLGSAEWYAFRVDWVHLVLAAVIVVGVSVGAGAWWTFRTDRDRRYSTRRSPKPGRRLVMIGAITAALALVVGGFVRNGVSLLLVAVFGAPLAAAAIALPLMRRVRPQGETAVTTVVRAYLAHRSAVVRSTTVLAAVLLVIIPSFASFVQHLGGQTSSERQLQAAPRASVAVYVGSAPLTPAGVTTLAHSVDAMTDQWHLLKVRTLVDGEQVQLPALPLPPGGCGGDVGTATPCGATLRGIGIANRASLQAVLGRSLNEQEATAYAAGSAVVLDPRLVTAGRLAIGSTVSLGQTGSAVVAIPAIAAALGTGSSLSAATPAVFVGTDLAKLPATVDQPSAGQLQVMFEFPAPISASQERDLRRMILGQVEIVGDDEYLFTWLDAARVGLVGRIVGHAAEANGIAATLVLFWQLPLSDEICFVRTGPHPIGCAARRDLTNHRDRCRTHRPIRGRTGRCHWLVRRIGCGERRTRTAGLRADITSACTGVAPAAHRGARLGTGPTEDEGGIAAA